jgi:hypothetical protein
MPLRKNAKVELIRSVPLFSSCSRELAQIASMTDEIDFPEGKTLMKEGGRLPTETRFCSGLCAAEGNTVVKDEQPQADP